MIKDDEKLLWKEIKNRDNPYIRDLVKELNIPEKRACYILSKWENNGLYEWGVNILAGWLTDKGKRNGQES